MEQAAVCLRQSGVTHSGTPLEPNRVLFAPAPTAIGSLRSAFSTQVAGRIDVRGWLIALSCAVVLALVVGLAFAIEFPIPTFVTFPAGAVVGIAVMVILRPRPECTYVGEQGISRIQCAAGKLIENTYVFSPDSSVGVQQTRVRVNGIYTGTDYTFTFYADLASQILKVSGRYYDFRGRVPRDSSWHFGSAAETALTEYLLPSSIRRIAQGAPVTFRLRPDMQIDFGRTGLTIEKSGRRSDVPYSILQSVDVASGEVTIREKGGEAEYFGLGSAGVFTFAYSDMPNARLFFLLLQRQIASARDARVEE